MWLFYSTPPRSPLHDEAHKGPTLHPSFQNLVWTISNHNHQITFPLLGEKHKKTTTNASLALLPISLFINSFPSLSLSPSYSPISHIPLPAIVVSLFHLWNKLVIFIMHLVSERKWRRVHSDRFHECCGMQRQTGCMCGRRYDLVKGEVLSMVQLLVSWMMVGIHTIALRLVCWSRSRQMQG